MDKHFTVLGALFIGLGIMGLIGLVVVVSLFSVGTAVLSAVAAQEPHFPPLVAWLPAGFGILIGLLIALTTVPCLVAGYGLLARRPWAGVLALIAGILNIPAFPVGTAVGIYAIWVFLQDDAQRSFAV
jgi:hypothetical protein